MKHPTIANIMNTITLPISALLLLVIGILWAFGQTVNRPPVVSNARAQQRPGTRLVDITYDVEDPDGDAMTVSVLISDDGGATFNVPAKTFSGDIGPGITSGKGKRIVWDAGADAPHIFGTNYAAKVIADDGVGPAEEIISEKDGATMRLIPAGEFEMGDHFNEGNSDERPVHTVYLDAFYSDVTEVTNAQYKKFMDATGHSAPGYWNDPNFNKPDYPVIGVSWYDAAAYCQWVGKRLPTEAEWEKAARGGLVGKRYPWGDEAPDGSQCNFADKNTNYSWSDKNADDGYAGTAPVGTYPPNGYGLYDMAGNVWEWCMDGWDSGFYAKSPKNNPVAGGTISFVNNNFTNVKTLRSLRGGSWDNYPYYVRVAYRGGYGPAVTDGLLGFRCVGNVTP